MASVEKMTTLLQLDILEKEIAKQIKDNFNNKNLDREIENQMLQLTFKKYKEIHKAYIELIKSGDTETQREALKRALFLQWIGSFEPTHLTGITTAFDTYEKDSVGLELKDFQFVYGYLDNLIENNSLDTELFEMLSYYSCWEFVFEYANFKDFKNLHHFVFNVADTKKHWTPLIKMRELHNRGQMGDYYLSISTE